MLLQLWERFTDGRRVSGTRNVFVFRVRSSGLVIARWEKARGHAYSRQFDTAGVGSGTRNIDQKFRVHVDATSGSVDRGEEAGAGLMR